MKKRIQKEQNESKRAIRKILEENGSNLQTLLAIIEAGKIAVNELIYDTGKVLIECLFHLSAEKIAGEKKRGKRGEGIYWHGSQKGVVNLQERKVSVERPRLRRKAGGQGAEIEIPAYKEMQKPDVGIHMVASMLRGISTRKYEEVLPEMAESAGIKKSSVSRNYIRQSEKKLQEFAERRWDGIPIVAIFIDGVHVGGYQVLVALGIDGEGIKHVLGIVEGTTENSEVVKALLSDLVERGISPSQPILFIVDGAKALRKGIREVFGNFHPLQRCRIHKERNVLGYLPMEEQKQTRWVMKAAWKCEAQKGIAKLKEHADWLEKKYPKAAASLREGLEEMFTIKRLGLPSSLCRSFGTTNIIENPNSLMRRRTRNVTNWQNGNMVMRWMVTAYTDAELHFHRIGGYKDLWTLEAALQTYKDNAILGKVA